MENPTYPEPPTEPTPDEEEILDPEQPDEEGIPNGSDGSTITPPTNVVIENLLLAKTNTVVDTSQPFIPSAAIQSLTADKVAAGTIKSVNIESSVYKNTFNKVVASDGTTTVRTKGNLVIDGEIKMDGTIQDGSKRTTHLFIDALTVHGHVAKPNGTSEQLFELSAAGLFLNSPNPVAITSNNELELYSYGERKVAVGVSMLSLWADLHMRGNDITNINSLNFLNSGATIFTNGNMFSFQTRGEIEYGIKGVRVLRMGKDAAGEFVQMHSAYNRTTSSNANTVIAPDATFRRATSAKKYKTDIKTSKIDPYLILKLEPKSWIDKAEKEIGDIQRRYYGLIADDVYDIGLGDYVTYENDEVDGLMYDRLWTLLIPIVRDLKEENEQLKIKLEEIVQ